MSDRKISKVVRDEAGGGRKAKLGRLAGRAGSAALKTGANVVSASVDAAAKGTKAAVSRPGPTAASIDADDDSVPRETKLAWETFDQRPVETFDLENDNVDDILAWADGVKKVGSVLTATQPETEVAPPPPKLSEKEQRKARLKQKKAELAAAKSRAKKHGKGKLEVRTEIELDDQPSNTWLPSIEREVEPEAEPSESGVQPEKSPKQERKISLRRKSKALATSEVREVQLSQSAGETVGAVQAGGAVGDRPLDFNTQMKLTALRETELYTERNRERRQEEQAQEEEEAAQIDPAAQMANSMDKKGNRGGLLGSIGAKGGALIGGAAKVTAALTKEATQSVVQGVVDATRETLNAAATEAQTARLSAAAKFLESTAGPEPEPEPEPEPAPEPELLWEQKTAQDGTVYYLNRRTLHTTMMEPDDFAALLVEPVQSEVTLDDTQAQVAPTASRNMGQRLVGGSAKLASSLVKGTVQSTGQLALGATSAAVNIGRAAVTGTGAMVFDTAAFSTLAAREQLRKKEFTISVPKGELGIIFTWPEDNEGVPQVQQIEAGHLVDQFPKIQIGCQLLSVGKTSVKGLPAGAVMALLETRPANLQWREAAAPIPTLENSEFHAFFDAKVAAGEYDFDLMAPQNEERTKVVIDKAVSEFEEMLQDVEAARLATGQKALKARLKHEKSRAGKREAQADAAEMLRLANEQVAIQAAEKQHMESVMAEQERRREASTLDFTHPGSARRAQKQAKEKLERQKQEFSLWSEFQKDPMDPEGQYLDYLSKLEGITQDKVLEFWDRMRRKFEIDVVEDDEEKRLQQEEAQRLAQNSATAPALMYEVISEQLPVRASYKQDSEVIATLEHGDEFEVIEERTSETAVRSVKFSLTTQPPMPSEPDPITGSITMSPAIVVDAWVDATSEDWQDTLKEAQPMQELKEEPTANKKKTKKKWKARMRKKFRSDGDKEFVDTFEDLQPPELDPVLVELVESTVDIQPPILIASFPGHTHTSKGKLIKEPQDDWFMTADDKGYMDVCIGFEHIIVPGGSVGSVRRQLDDVTIGSLTLKKESSQAPTLSKAWLIAIECHEKEVKIQKQQEETRTKLRDMKLKKEAEEEKKADEAALKAREKEKKAAAKADKKEAKYVARIEDEAEKQRQAELQELASLQRSWELQRKGLAKEHSIRSPYEVLTELREQCDRYIEEFPMVWDRFVDIFSSNREKVVANMQRSLQVCKMLPKLADRKKKLQAEMIESLVDYERDIAVAKFEGANIKDDDEREDRIIDVVDVYLQQLGKFERKKFASLVKDGDLMLARRMATGYLHEYWKEHSRVSAGLYNYLIDVDRQVESSLHSIPRDTLDLFRTKLQLELELDDGIVNEEDKLLPDPLEPFTREEDRFAHGESGTLERDLDLQRTVGHHSDAQYAPDLPGCYWTGIYEGCSELMMELKPKKPNPDGSGMTGVMESNDGLSYWCRIRLGTLELWNKELPRDLQRGVFQEGFSTEFFIERELILLYIYSYVKTPDETNPTGLLIINGTMHVEEFTCPTAQERNNWIEAFERARSWAVDREELRQFSGVEDHIDYEEFMEFQKTKAKDREAQIEKMRTFVKDADKEANVQDMSRSGQRAAKKQRKRVKKLGSYATQESIATSPARQAVETHRSLSSDFANDSDANVKGKKGSKGKKASKKSAKKTSNFALKVKKKEPVPRRK